MNFKLQRRHAARLLLAATAAASFGTSAIAHDNDDGDDNGSSLRHGKLFISTNAPAGNEVLVYQRSGSGPATLLSRFATQGTGTGAGLGSQGANPSGNTPAEFARLIDAETKKWSQLVKASGAKID